MSPVHYQHGPKKPAEAQWNHGKRESFLEKKCMRCSMRIVGSEPCITYFNLDVVVKGHRSFWTTDGPLYVDEHGNVACKRYKAK